MKGSTPQFPAFDDWQRMSETEQDALLSRMEAARRRGAIAYRLLVALACAGAVAIAVALLQMW